MHGFLQSSNIPIIDFEKKMDQQKLGYCSVILETVTLYLDFQKPVPMIT